jgi:hypothetical protein
LHKITKESNSSSSDERDSPKSSKGTRLHAFDAHYLNAKSKIYEKSIRNNGALTMKSITNKSNNVGYPRGGKEAYKSSSSYKQHSATKTKPKKSKYLNTMGYRKVTPGKREQKVSSKKSDLCK